jgi:hypothetical protein
MLTCPKCHTVLPEGMRFCLQCGAPLATAPPSVASPSSADPKTLAPAAARPAPHVPPAPPARVSAPPQTPRKTLSAAPPKIAPLPAVTPRPAAAADYARPSLGDTAAEVDDESLKKSFERPVTHPGAVLCRFCKVPLDVAADFCTHCGAPVAEAAPPGAITPKPQPAAAPALLDDDPLSPHDKTVSVTPPAELPLGNAAGQRLSAALPPPEVPVALTEPLDPTPTPVAPPPPAEKPPLGLMGRFKRLFRKG